MRRVWAGAAACALALSACAGDEQQAEGAVVFAAASLHAPFEALGEASGATFSFDGSSGLVDQLAGGARADVFASADQRTMDRAVELGLVDGEPRLFATNHLVLVTPADNPADVTGLDASLDGTKLVVCATEVPCGAATQRLAKAAGVALHPVSEETSVTNALGKVTSGEADAAFVYATDAASAADELQILEVPAAATDPNTYWIARVAGGDEQRAQAFIDEVLGDGQQALRDAGFGAPR